MFALPTAAVFNHLLAQNSWAVQRLAGFAGKTIRFDIAPLSITYSISVDGYLNAAGAPDVADAVFNIPPSLLPRLMLQDDSAYSEIRSEGDPELLKEVFFLSRHFRWDAAEDLSHLTGDIAAEQIMHAMQHGRRVAHNAALNFSRATAEYLTDEHAMLAKPVQLASYVKQIDQLRDDVARLEQRIARIRAGR